MTIDIVYFSGTGCTRLVAEGFQAEFTARGHATRLRSVGQAAGVASAGLTVADGTAVDKLDDKPDLLLACFAVHACNAPAPLERWVRQLSPQAGRPAPGRADVCDQRDRRDRLRALSGDGHVGRVRAVVFQGMTSNGGWRVSIRC